MPSGYPQQCKCGHLKGDHTSNKNECLFVKCGCKLFRFEKYWNSTKRNLN